MKTFRQIDVRRALKGAASAGFDVERVEISPEGKIVLSRAKGAASPDDAANAFDKWQANHAHPA
jgi:hypothetical protein